VALLTAESVIKNSEGIGDAVQLRAAFTTVLAASRRRVEAERRAAVPLSFGYPARGLRCHD
jgi:hypothetical protein